MFECISNYYKINYKKATRSITKVILHCSDSDNEFQPISEIRKWHLIRGFNDVGYHYFITPQGKLEFGRDESVIGAHVAGHNTESIGVCLAGKKIFSVEQFKTLTKLLKALKFKYPKSTLHGHKEFNVNKTCPNFNYYKIIENWKNGKYD